MESSCTKDEMRVLLDSVLMNGQAPQDPNHSLPADAA